MCRKLPVCKYAAVVTERSGERRQAREEKIKPPRPRNEMLTEMERLLDQKKAERRRRDVELKIGQEDGTSQQRLIELTADRVHLSLFHTAFLSACCSM